MLIDWRNKSHQETHLPMEEPLGNHGEEGMTEDPCSSLTLRHVLRLPNGLSRAGASQSILISDSGCDQMLVTSIWHIVSHTG